MAFHIRVEEFDGRILDETRLLDGEVVVGRGDECDLRLPANNVSRRHARLFVHLGRCYVEDLGSSNGIISDGRRIAGIEQVTGTVALVVGQFVVRISDAPALGAAPPTHNEEPDLAPRASRPSLAIRQSGRTTEIVPLHGERVRVGRVAENDVVLADSSVSRNHAVLSQRNGEWVLEDLGSSNGTLVDQRRIDRPTVMRDGDTILFGDVPAVYTTFPENIDTGVWPMIQPASKWSPSLVATVGATALAVVGIVSLFVMWSARQQAPEPAPVPELAQSDDVESVERALERREWAEVLRLTERIDPEGKDAARLTQARQQATGEEQAQLRQDECAGVLESARETERRREHRDALARWLEAESCLAGVPRRTVAGDAADAVLRSDVRPAILTLHRTLAREASEAGQHADAVRQLEAAHVIVTQTTDTALSAELVAVGRELRTSLLAAAAAAAQGERWERALTHYLRAGSLRPLNEDERLAAARAQRALDEANER